MELINNVNWTLWNNLAIKLKCYRKNFDLITENENFISLYTGTISKLRIDERKLPLLIGEHSLSTWNLILGRMFDVDFLKLIHDHRFEDTYSELYGVINSKKLDINGYNKLLFIHSLVLHEDYRKCNITEEVIESIFRDFYDEKTLIIALVKPIQDNYIDFSTYDEIKTVKLKDTFDSTNIPIIPASKYYNLNNLLNKDDRELNEYKLYAVANRCGFKRIGDSHLFSFTPENTILRMKNKYIYGSKNKKHKKT